MSQDLADKVSRARVSERDTSSEEFNSDDGDVTFRSVDRVVFKIHSVYLNVNTKRFATPDGTKVTQAVELTEDSDTLTLLFRFIYPARHPDLEDLDFPRLHLLAIAAEKYCVFAAMNTCKIRMKHSLPQHAEEILLYGMKHEYRDIMDAAAPLVIHVPLKDLSSGMPIEGLKSWINYHDCWQQTHQRALRYLLKDHRNVDGRNLSLTHKASVVSLQQSSSSDLSTPTIPFSTPTSMRAASITPAKQTTFATSPFSTPEKPTAPFQAFQKLSSSKSRATPTPSATSSSQSTRPLFASSSPTPSVMPFSQATTGFPSPAAPSITPAFPPPLHPSPFAAFIPDPDPTNHWCAEGSRKIVNILGQMATDIGVLRNLDEIFNAAITCSMCRATLDTWKKAIETDVGQIPSLSTFI